MGPHGIGNYNFDVSNFVPYIQIYKYLCIQKIRRPRNISKNAPLFEYSVYIIRQVSKYRNLNYDYLEDP